MFAKHAAATAHPNLARAAKSTGRDSRAGEKLQPHKIKYYRNNAIRV